jgi:hypothetical protein
MPVTRHPPCSPGRTVFPSPVPRLSSHPRCKALSSRKHPPSLDLRDVRPDYPSPVQTLGKLLPGNTLPLPPAPMAPCKRTAQRALEKALQGTGVPLQTVVVVVTSQAAVHSSVARASRQVPGLFDPCRHPSARRLKLLTCGAPLDTWHALAIGHPIQFDSQKREAPPQARRKTPAAQKVRLVGGDLKVACRQPLWEHPINPFRILLRPEGADPVIGIAAQQCLAATVDLHHRVEPPIQGVVQIGSKDGALFHYWGTSPPSALRTGRATRRCTQLASDSLSPSACADVQVLSVGHP